jgi:outer membrane protein assembly factor BamD (BamD/ComL family)
MKYQIKIIILVLLLTICTLFIAAQDAKSTEEIEKEAKETFSLAKKLIYDKEWAKAAAAFENIVEKFKSSSFVDDSFYWRAFSLNKMSQDIEEVEKGLEIKKEALRDLAVLIERFPSSKWCDDARLLTVEIAGDLAAKGIKGYEKYILNGVKEDEEAEMKALALASLLQVDKEKAISTAEKIIRTGKNAKLKEKAIFVLAQQGGSRVIAILAEAAERDTDDRVKKQAIFWLGQMGTQESFQQLVRMYDSFPGIELKKQLLFSIAHSGRDEAAKELIRIFKKENNIELKKQIVFWIGNSNSKEARDFILKILE